MENFIDISSGKHLTQTGQWESNIITLEFKKLFNVIQNKENQEQRLLNFGLKYSVYLIDLLQRNSNLAIKRLQQFVQALIEQKNQLIAFYLFYTLFGVFLKCSCVGPDFTYINPDKKLQKERKDKAQIIKQKTFEQYDFTDFIEHYRLPKQLKAVINQYNYQFIKLQNFSVRSKSPAIEILSVDGEMWPRLLPYSNVFLASQLIIKELKDATQERYPTVHLWCARLYFLHNRVIDFPASSLQKVIFQNYAEFYEYLSKNKQTLTRDQLSNFYVEYANCSVFYYKYTSANNALMQSQNILNVRYNFTGKMGVRSKYQTFKVAQLIVEPVSIQEKEMIDEEEQSIMNPRDIIGTTLFTPKSIALEQESILFETPKLDDEQEEESQTGEGSQEISLSDVTDHMGNVEKVFIKNKITSDLTLSEQVLALGLITTLDKSTPHDEIFYQYVQAYCNILVAKSNNWLVYSDSLLKRSVNEYIRFKRMERALSQFEVLVSQFNDNDPQHFERLKYFFALDFPHYFGLQKTVAEKEMQIGLVMSSCNKFEQLGFYEECVECLANAGRVERAKQMALKLMQESPTAKLYCIYADLTNDIAFYKQSWKFSNQKYHRAQKSIGRMHMYRKNFAKAIKAFKKSVEINSYQPNTWFMMGHCYQQLNEPKDAIQAFSTVVSIDQSQGEAWANLAALFAAIGKKAEAFSTLEQAVKHCENNWKIWHNLLFVSYQNKKFYRFFDCIQKLVQLDHKDLIEEGVVLNLNQVIKFNISLYGDIKFRGQVDTIRNRMQKLYNFLADHCGTQSHIWLGYANFVEYLVDFQEIKASIKMNDIQDQNDSEAEKLIQINLETQQKALLEKVADLRLKRCHTLTIVGWENDKVICEKLFTSTCQLIEIYKKTKGEVDMKEIEMYIKTIRNPIQKALGKAVEFPPLK